MPDISPENLLYIEQTLIAMAWEISFFGAYLYYLISLFPYSTREIPGFFTAVVLMSTWVLMYVSPLPL